MKRHLATNLILLALTSALCAQAQSTANPGSPIQNTATYPVPQTNPAQRPSSAPKKIYLPSGLDLQIRVNEGLNSGTSQAGDTFTGTLLNSIEDDDNNIIFARGTPVTGRVISAKPSGRLQDSGELVLSLNSIRSETQVANVTTISKTINGESHGESNAKKVGGGAILGAIIGGIAGGGKGAAIGAGAGAAAGTGAAAATGKKEAKIDPESIVRFVTSTETAVVPAGSPADREMARQPNVYNGSGPRDENAPVLQRRRDRNDQDGNPPQSPQPQNQDGYPAQSPSRPTSTIARNGGDSDAPVLRRREGSDSDVSTPSGSNDANNNATNTANGGANNTTASPSTNTSATTNANVPASPGTEWAFSVRDKRVITSCLADNPGSVPAADANAIPYYKGDTLPYAAQKKIQSLPLACERQLPVVASDQERIIYNQQVLLINTNNLVLDSFDIPKQ